MTRLERVAESIRNAQADDVDWEEETEHWQAAVDAALEALGYEWDGVSQTVVPLDNATTTARIRLRTWLDTWDRNFPDGDARFPDGLTGCGFANAPLYVDDIRSLLEGPRP